MIQELLGGSNVGLISGTSDSRSKLSTGGCGSINLDGSSNSHSPSSSAAAAGNGSATATATATTSENLRCPRCDSSNTKFCYYNNYNLTQPRHFCKTCRRYWTKGGALRNVPIGGGCRKNKNTTITAAVGKSSTAAAGRFKTVSTDMGKSNSTLFGGFEHDQIQTISTNPIIWASSQNSHFLSLLRANQNPNPVKDENAMFGSSNLISESVPISSNGSLNARVLGLDPLGPTHLPSMGISNSFYRNQIPTSQGAGIIHGEVHNNGIQELYQRLIKTSTNCYPNPGEHAPVILGNVAINSSSTGASILESAPVASTGELGFWNASLSWPTDLPTTTNGAAYP